MNKAIFFDRDGIINTPPTKTDYILTWQDFHFTPNITTILTQLKEQNWLTILITNQQCIGKKITTLKNIKEIHNQMQNELAKHNAEFDLIKMCPHLQSTCLCRKPSPKMILDASQKLNIDRQKSWLIGDQDTDIAAGNSANLKTIRLKSPYPNHSKPNFYIDTITEITKIIDIYTYRN